jgi:hypothetical protein
MSGHNFMVCPVCEQPPEVVKKAISVQPELVKAEAVVKIWDKDGNLKSKLDFTSDFTEEDSNATG